MGHVVWVTKNDSIIIIEQATTKMYSGLLKSLYLFAALATTKSLATVHWTHPMYEVEQCQLVAKVTTNAISAHACRAAALDIHKWCQPGQHQWGKRRIGGTCGLHWLLHLNGHQLYHTARQQHTIIIVYDNHKLCNSYYSIKVCVQQRRVILLYSGTPL